MSENQYELIIVGTGPAGLTAAIYGQRLGMRTIVFGDTPGGNLYMIETLSNYPGFAEGITGSKIGLDAFTQARKEGAFLPMTRLNLLSHDGEQFMGIDADSHQYFARAALLACGAEPKIPDIPNADNKGIYYSALAEGPLFRNRQATLGVIGCGLMAVNESLYLSGIAGRVILICQEPELEAEISFIKALQKRDNVYVLLNTRVVSFVSRKEHVEGLLVIVGEEKKKIRVNGVFMAVGWEPNLKILKIPVKTCDNRFIKTDKRLMSSFPGLFAAGDVRDTDMRQVITACADGARAASYVYKYLRLEI